MEKVDNRNKIVEKIEKMWDGMIERDIIVDIKKWMGNVDMRKKVEKKRNEEIVKNEDELIIRNGGSEDKGIKK